MLWIGRRRRGPLKLRWPLLDETLGAAPGEFLHEGMALPAHQTRMAAPRGVARMTSDPWITGSVGSASRLTLLPIEQ